MNNEKTPENTGKKEKKVDGRLALPQIFKKGQSGNPDGRPKGSENFTTKFKRAIEIIAKANKIDDVDEVEIQLFITAYKKAKGGDYRYYQDIIDRLYGKPQSSVDITSKGESIQGNSIVFRDYGAGDK